MDISLKRRCFTPANQSVSKTISQSVSQNTSTVIGMSSPFISQYKRTPTRSLNHSTSAWRFQHLQQQDSLAMPLALNSQPQLLRISDSLAHYFTSMPHYIFPALWSPCIHWGSYAGTWQQWSALMASTLTIYYGLYWHGRTTCRTLYSASVPTRRPKASDWRQGLSCQTIPRKPNSDNNGSSLCLCVSIFVEWSSFCAVLICQLSTG